MDLVDLMTEKAFLGQEFLTWLWFKSEERGGAVRLENSGIDVELVFEKHILLESGEGESYEKLICQGLQAELKEARTGLAMGKKIEQARLLLTRDAYEYHLTLKGSLFEFRSVRLPKTMAGAEESDEAGAVEGRILDRIALYEMCVRTMDELFGMFLARRAGDDWPRELTRLSEWIRSANLARQH